ncbi:hypothetical protein [Xenorhabdus sp. BG5]|uniref:hypothetical protein n=1 Tax=Xenorhabdus sp. BG5 TaxID=2782014 RepID=UPI001882A184|nr:hypothetical protein [Xenorhabdus sp. BG5]MBE8597221.1 hypothetical protein [Xenorhabdus sp. BG5]
MAGPLTAPVRINSFLERERRSGRHWRQYQAVTEYYYAGPVPVVGDPRRHYPLLHLAFTLDGIPNSLIYFINQNTHLILFLSPNFDQNNINQLTRRDMQDAVRGFRQFWF